MNAGNTCADCGGPFVRDGIGTGYGQDASGARYCYPCCGKRDARAMEETGRATLYLTKTDDGRHAVTNWPGTLRIPVGYVSASPHNIARRRYDFRFTYAGRDWSGVQYGDNTQIAHCRRLKARGGAK